MHVWPFTYSHVGIHEYMNSYKHLQSCFTRTQFLLWCSGARSVCGVNTCSTFRSMDVTWSWAMSRCAIACAWHVSCSSVGQDCSRKNHCQKPKLIAFRIETHSGSSPHPPWGCQAVNSRFFFDIFASHFFVSLYPKKCDANMTSPYQRNVAKKCDANLCLSIPKKCGKEMWCKYGLSIPKKCGKEMRYKYASLHQRNVQIYDFPSCASVDQSTACRFYALNRVKQTCIRVRTNHSARLPLQFS